MPDVFLLESAVITGIFYRQEEDIYTADVPDDRGGSLAPSLSLPENDATFSLSTGGWDDPRPIQPDHDSNAMIFFMYARYVR